MEHDGKLWEKNNVYMCVCMTGSLCCIVELTEHCKLTIIEKIKIFKKMMYPSDLLTLHTSISEKVLVLPFLCNMT